MENEVKESQGRPILEWYEQLPEPIRSQAIENYEPEFAEEVDGTASSKSEAIWWGFFWEKTKEGDDYWRDIHKRAKNGEFDSHSG